MTAAKAVYSKSGGQERLSTSLAEGFSGHTHMHALDGACLLAKQFRLAIDGNAVHELGAQSALPFVAHQRNRSTSEATENTAASSIISRSLLSLVRFIFDFIRAPRNVQRYTRNDYAVTAVVVTMPSSMAFCAISFQSTNWMAPLGHCSAQRPQAMHFVDTPVWCRRGHVPGASLADMPQPMHVLVSTTRAPVFVGRRWHGPGQYFTH